jgi:seryl-tRNA synthetase
MHDIKFIRENPKQFDEAMRLRGLHECADEILFIDKIVRDNINKIQALQHTKKEIAKQMSNFDKLDEKFSNLKKEGYDTKHHIQVLETQKSEAEKKLKHFLITLPNIPDNDVPFGESEEQNEIFRTVGEKRNFSFEVMSHYDLGKKLDLMDFETAAKISGSRFVILKKDLAKLERALASFMIDIHTKEFGYEEVIIPELVLEDTMFQAGQLPKFEDDSFKTTNGYRLIPTAEIPLVCMNSKKIVQEHDLPLRYVSYSHCFRSEAGSAGRDTKGMIRQHQFSKVELVSITSPNKSSEEFERMTSAAERILQKLELPYRISLLCSQDMGFCAAKTYDLEVWLPFEQKYREISSCSNCKDFQARRMNGRYKSLSDEKNHFFHTLNGSGLAIGRTIVAIIENYQNQDYSINIPDVLQPYMNNQKVITV